MVLWKAYSGVSCQITIIFVAIVHVQSCELCQNLFVSCNACDSSCEYILVTFRLLILLRCDSLTGRFLVRFVIIGVVSTMRQGFITPCETAY